MIADWHDEIGSVSKLVEFSENNCAIGPHTLFRGQPEDKPLLPKIGRGTCKPELLTQEQRLFAEFKIRSAAYLDATNRDDWDLLAIAQHNGMATSFFDSKGAVTGLVSGTAYTIFGAGTRIELNGLPNHAALALSDKKGHHLSINADSLQMGDESPHLSLLNDAIGPSLTLTDSLGRQRVILNGSSSAPRVELDDEKGFSRASLNLIDGRPLIVVNDSEGFSAQLGGVDLVTTRTGEQHKTSAASLVLFDKDGKVLWSAP